ncbi:RHS repeat-associated core domain-containing protein, partial [Vreelandella olivaria]|uniref:RHS repeat-associated core domain-containing protein n=1 Tax=Vreelandella olivaria TaxID=390919 RepID=UPI0024C26D12
WAATRNERGNTSQPIRFQGQWHDEESGLYYNRHRYYDPQQGRYISQDPIGLMGGDNLYQYAAAPNLEVEPLGLRGVYGLGGGPYSQSNMVRRTAAPQELNSRTVAMGADAGGEIFGGIFGSSLSIGRQLDSRGQVCAVSTACTKLGIGAYAGAGITGGASINDSVETGISESWGFFMQGGSGLASGASASFGNGAFGAAKGFMGVGTGGPAGVQFCRISTVCPEESSESE